MKLSGELLRFVGVGVSALLVHFGLVVWLFVPRGVTPLLANLLAFLGAFQVSYWGHRCWTFSGSKHRHAVSLPRFLGVAGLSFALNEMGYFVLLHVFGWDYRYALLCVLGVVAGSTFVLSKYWAFAGGTAQ